MPPILFAAMLLLLPVALAAGVLAIFARGWRDMSPDRRGAVAAAAAAVDCGTILALLLVRFGLTATNAAGVLFMAIIVASTYFLIRWEAQLRVRIDGLQASAPKHVSESSDCETCEK